MKNAKDSFIRGRLRSLKFAFKGAWLLLTTEDSIKAQVLMAVIVTVMGFCFDISNIEWMLQFSCHWNGFSCRSIKYGR